MIDPSDYKEPRCACEGGEEFYNPKKDAPKGNVPVMRIIDKLDKFFEKNDMQGAGEFLRRWEAEAKDLNDKQGELTIQSELIGYYRKTEEEERGLNAIERALYLIEELKMTENVSSATIYLNCATTYKSFKKIEKAIPLYKKAEEVYKKYLKEDDIRFGGLYNNYALALVDLKRYDEAEKLYNKALSIMKKAEGREADVAITYVNMANMYEVSLSEPDEKITECMDAALNILNDEKVARNGYYAATCNKCADAFGYYGYFVAEDELKRRAKEIYERA